MGLKLSIWENAARIRAELRIGAAVVLVRGRAGVLAGAAESLTAERLEDFRGADDGDVARIILTPDFDLGRVRATADPARDLEAPMKGPYQTRRDGDAGLHRAAVRLTKQAQLLPAALVASLPSRAAAEALARENGLSILDTDALLAAEAEAIGMRPVSAARVPLEASAASRVHVFRPDDGSEEHYAIEIGTPKRSEPVLARLHSACFTGDVLGSLKCDCGPQLRAAGQQDAGLFAAGSGLRHGRGQPPPGIRG